MTGVATCTFLERGIPITWCLIIRWQQCTYCRQIVYRLNDSTRNGESKHFHLWYHIIGCTTQVQVKNMCPFGWQDDYRIASKPLWWRSQFWATKPTLYPSRQWQELARLRSAGKWFRFLGAKGCYLWIHSLTKEVTALRPQGDIEEQGISEHEKKEEVCGERDIAVYRDERAVKCRKRVSGKQKWRSNRNTKPRIDHFLTIIFYFPAQLGRRRFYPERPSGHHQQ